MHAETSTGVGSDAEAIATMAHAHGALVIADTVTSLGGIPVLVDEWGLDAVYSGSQKCLSCTPGLSPVTFGEAALEKVKARKTKCQSWFMDLNLVLPYWEGGARTYHHTAPINPLYGLHESLLMLTEEGLEAAWRRHAELHAALVEGLEGLGLSMFVEAPYRLPQLNLVERARRRRRRLGPRRGAQALRPRARQRPRRARRQGLAHRPHGHLVHAGQRRPLPGRARDADRRRPPRSSSLRTRRRWVASSRRLYIVHRAGGW